jgi:hypothetical protein
MATVKVALVELGGSHDECLLTQMQALREIDVHTTLIVNEVIWKRNPHFAPLVDEVFFVEPEGRAIGDVLTMRKLVRYLRKKEIGKVVFNTAQGGHVRNIAVLMPRNIQCYGIIHTIRKFHGSATQSIINRMISSYLVLSDDLLKRVKPRDGIAVGSFYPVCFPAFEKELEKPEGETWVTITGGVENRRKDLSGVLGFIEKAPEGVKFIFLGKTDAGRPDAQQFLTGLAERGLDGRVVRFTDYVDAETFDAVLRNTDFLLPLIHPGTPSAEQYISNQISGAFTVAYGYKIPLLIHNAFNEEDDLKNSAVFYNMDNFHSVLQESIPRQRELSYRIGGNPKWTKNFQMAKYRGFLGLV